MFGFFTFPHKVTVALESYGYSRHTIPFTQEWAGLIHAFRKAGYPPERAANIIADAFLQEPEALAEATAIGGVYAIAVFTASPPPRWP